MTPLLAAGLTALALWPLQNVQHEGAHALMAKHYGARITRFTPYPNWKSGRFTWASVAWEGGTYTSEGRAFISIAPQAANTWVLFVLALLSTAPLTPYVTAVLTGAVITQFVDGAWNLGTFYKWWIKEDYDKHTDGWKFQMHFYLHPTTCRVGAAVWHLLFGGLLFSLLLRVAQGPL
jgi:hypothetical protein